ncbi:hypothetical protein POX_a00140 [Penicillium oxalicum]|uniref:Uncharacterized protein n=1 Tax=Penicillium oxalicum (strain 114-2 / CGMCC 5302) TaxID=933388 RepID=S8B7G4_PENO1|nr:hypothetical protein POX_a00140 [Penicillium oxalicum]EPS34893.1 hypothetical protein PDE_09857 [Penicillium oxalicum 114-2]KAI2793559.1 hypothetical protein POX_a00140 [Penicillium oxalicum]
MLSLTIVIAIAASAAGFFVVLGVVGIVVWVRIRKERHAMRMLGFREPNRSRKVKTYKGDTLTELSLEDSNALRTHGGLPYGKPTEWGHLTSRETLVRPKSEPETSWPLMERARSLRNSIRRARSKRFNRTGQRQTASMATVSEAGTMQDNIPLSAVEGILELPADQTPRQTPEIPREENCFHVGMRPMSPAGAWPPPTQHTRPHVFHGFNHVASMHDVLDPIPMLGKESPARVRGGSIISQTAGHAPDQSIPPPPPALFGQERFSYLRNDSVMRLSSMSIDTTNSSILEDGRNGSRSADIDLVSPIFPSGGTFVPYSANDVGVENGRRSYIAANTSMPPSFVMRSSSNAGGSRKVSGETISPRRSMTTTARLPGNSNIESQRLPRRSESLSYNQSRTHHSLRAGNLASMNMRWSDSNGSTSRPLASNMSTDFQSSQHQQRQTPHSAYDALENDPFYCGSPASTGSLFSVGSPIQPRSRTPQSPMQRSSGSLKGPLHSALGGSNSHRKSKGHRRQNCVRISIHPPMTFGGPAFSPTVEEEPEDLDAMEEVDLRETAIQMPSQPQPSRSPDGPRSQPRSGRQASSRRNKPSVSSSLAPLAEEPQSLLQTRVPSKKRKKAPSDILEEAPLFVSGHGLPGIFTSVPPPHEVDLSHTPSPERESGVWELRENQPPVDQGHVARETPSGPRTPPRTKQHDRQSLQSSHGSSSGAKGQSTPLKGPLSPKGDSRMSSGIGDDWRNSIDSLYASPGSYRQSRGSQRSSFTETGSVARPVSPLIFSKGSGGKEKVTIWEDANRSASPTKRTSTQFAAGYTFQLETNLSPSYARMSVPRSLPKREEQSPTRPSGSRATPTLTPTRRTLMTPTGKGLGIGVTCATPVSLYDGDGFLKE